MKTRLFILLLFGCSMGYGQTSYGVSFFYGTGNLLGMDFYVTPKRHSIFIGYGIQFNGQRNIETDIQSNYGQTLLKEGDFIRMVDIGVCYNFKKPWSLSPEIGIGRKSHFKKYKDLRFTEGVYTAITDNKSVFALGCTVGRRMTPYIETLLGYNSVKGVFFGVKLVLGDPKDWGRK